MRKLFQRRAKPFLETSVPGEWGLGKVRLKYYRKDHYKNRFALLGPLLFFFGAALCAFRWSWSKPWLRENFCVPVLRGAMHGYDSLRLALYRDEARRTLTAAGLDAPRAAVTLTLTPTLARISASSLPEAAFGQGLAHATERLFAMDLQRRRALGRAAELLGPPAVQADVAARTLGLHLLAEADWAALGGDECVAFDSEEGPQCRAEGHNSTAKPSTSSGKEASLRRLQRAVLLSYAAGVNRVIDAENRHALKKIDYLLLPGSFQWVWSLAHRLSRGLLGSLTAGQGPVAAWHPAHSLAILRLRSVQQSRGWEEEMVRGYLWDSLDDAGRAALGDLGLGEAGQWAEPEDKSRGGGDGAGPVELPCASGQGAYLLRRVGAAGSARAPEGSDGDLYLASFGAAEDLFAVELEARGGAAAWIGAQEGASGAAGANESGRGLLAGLSLPGVPLVLQGRNQWVAWVTADRTAASESVHREKLREVAEGTEGKAGKAGQGREYWSEHTAADRGNKAGEGEWRAVHVRRERLLVAGAEEEEWEVQATHRGPLVGRALTPSLPHITAHHTPRSLSSHALRSPGGMSFYLQMAAAQSWADLDAAASDPGAPNANLLFLDRRGDAGYAVAGAGPGAEAQPTTARGARAGAALSAARRLPRGTLAVAVDAVSPGRLHHLRVAAGHDEHAYATAAAAATASAAGASGGVAGSSGSGSGGVGAGPALPAFLWDAFSPSSRGLCALIADAAAEAQQRGLIPPIAGAGASASAGAGAGAASGRAAEGEARGLGGGGVFELNSPSERAALGGRVAWAVAVCGAFDGHYAGGGDAPVLIEAFRHALLELLLQPLPRAVQPFLLGQSLTSIPKPRVAARIDTPWLLALLARPDPPGAGAAEGYWLAAGGGRFVVLLRAVEAAVRWAEVHGGRGQGWTRSWLPLLSASLSSSLSSLSPAFSASSFSTLPAVLTPSSRQWSSIHARPLPHAVNRHEMLHVPASRRLAQGGASDSVDFGPGLRGWPAALLEGPGVLAASAGVSHRLSVGFGGQSGQDGEGGGGGVSVWMAVGHGEDVTRWAGGYADVYEIAAGV